jgi:hypothetical protein
LRVACALDFEGEDFTQNSGAPRREIADSYLAASYLE